MTAAPPATRVLLVLGSLEGGGAERVAVNLVNGCDPDRLDLRVGVLRRGGAYLAEVSPDRLAGPLGRGRGALDAARAPGDVAGMIAATRPDVVMSFGMGPNLAVWASRGRPGPQRPFWICREDSNTLAEIANLSSNGPARTALAAMLRRMHGRCDCLLAVSEDMGRGLAGKSGGAPVRVIHNPVDVDAIEAAARRPLAEPPPRPYVIAAARLVHQKGLDLLIAAFARCRSAQGLDLVILGDGPLEATLKRQATYLGIADRVRFPGFQSNPWAWFAGARLFVLPSRWEGFGNVVAEAMACGVPALVSNCDFGPREQVVHGVSGWVAAPSVDSLATAMETLLGDAGLCQRLAGDGRERARNFATPAIVEAYARLFLERPKAGSARAPWPAPNELAAAS